MSDPRPPRIAGLAPDDAYGATALEALRRAVAEGGGEVGQTLVYPPDYADPSAVVRQIAGYDDAQPPSRPNASGSSRAPIPRRRGG